MGVKGWREHLPFMQVNVNSHMGVNKKAVCENWWLIAILSFGLSCFLTVFQLYFQIKNKKKSLQIVPQAQSDSSKLTCYPIYLSNQFKLKFNSGIAFLWRVANEWQRSPTVSLKLQIYKVQGKTMQYPITNKCSENTCLQEGWDHWSWVLAIWQKVLGLWGFKKEAETSYQRNSVSLEWHPFGGLRTDAIVV